MFFYAGYSCPVCGKAFMQSDDIVTCPDCGAPHHRACWKEIGSCYYAKQHGTPEQWSKEREIPSQDPLQQPAEPTEATMRMCTHCGHQNSIFAEFCAGCGQPIEADDWQSKETENSYQTPPYTPFGTPYREYRPFHAQTMPYENIPDDHTDMEGVTAGALRIFVGQNYHYYLPKFLNFARKKSKVAWNWAAFLLTPYWLWYRKQYLYGTLVMLCEILQTAVNAFFLYGYIGLNADQIPQNTTTFRWLMVMFALYMIDLGIRLLFGLLGSYFYYRTAKRRIRQAPPDEPADRLAQRGGVSFGLGAAAYCVLYILTSIFSALFMRL